MRSCSHQIQFALKLGFVTCLIGITPKAVTLHQTLHFSPTIFSVVVVVNNGLHFHFVSLADGGPAKCAIQRMYLTIYKIKTIKSGNFRSYSLAHTIITGCTRGGCFSFRRGTRGAKTKPPKGLLRSSKQVSLSLHPYRVVTSVNCTKCIYVILIT